MPDIIIHVGVQLQSMLKVALVRSVPLPISQTRFTPLVTLKFRTINIPTMATLRRSRRNQQVQVEDSVVVKEEDEIVPKADFSRFALDSNRKRNISTASKAAPVARITRSTRRKVEVKEEIVADDFVENDAGQSVVVTTDKTAQKKKKVMKRDTSRIKKENTKMPIDFYDTLSKIEEMRKGKDAEVDTMGCESNYDEKVPDNVARFHVFVSCMLSSQTKDNVNAAAMARLRQHGLTIENIIATEQKTVAELIKPVGFYNNKARFLKEACEIMKKQSEEKKLGYMDIPNTLDELLKFKGIGPKMAYLIMTCAWNKICNRLKWLNTWNKQKPQSQQPERTRKELEEWLPRQYWASINPLLVGFGQQICLPVKPRCSECLLRDSCPASTAKTRKQKKTNN